MCGLMWAQVQKCMCVLVQMSGVFVLLLSTGWCCFLNKPPGKE